MADWGVRLSKLAQFLATGGTVPDTAISTAETDTSLRLAPDGAGGVEWGTGGGGSLLQMSVDILQSPTGNVTVNVNSTTYVDLWTQSFVTDFDVTPWTDFLIYGFGQSNAAGQTITAQASHSGTSALSAGGNDVVITNAIGDFTTAWIPIAASLTGVQRLSVLLKGSNATVDFTYQRLGIVLKYDP